MEELIIKAKKGDKKAFTELVLNIQNDLYRIGKTRLNDDNDIGDAIQETMIKSYKNIRKLKNNEKFKSWIIKILINECNSIYKKRRKKQILFDKISEENLINNQIDSIQESDLNMDFETLIKNLNYEEKLVITLFYSNKCSCNEISDILNMNINTVKSKLNRAKEKIKKYYEGGLYNVQ